MIVPSFPFMKKWLGVVCKEYPLGKIYINNYIYYSLLPILLNC